MSQPIRGQNGHFVFPINPKNTNLVGDVEILVTLKYVAFCLAFSEKKSKMSQSIRDFASCQVSLNSVEQFQRRSQKCESLCWTDGTDGVL